MNGFWTMDGSGTTDGRRPTTLALPHRRPSFVARLACAVLLALILAALAPALHAQVPDTTRALPADTLRPPADSLAPDSLAAFGADTLAQRRRPPRPLLAFDDALPGAPTDAVLPVRRAVTDAAELLARVPGAFAYSFGAIGWPDGWSLHGLSPQRAALFLDGLPFDDPLTGRPRYDLLPLDLLRPLGVGPGRHGAAAGVYARTRPYVFARPLSELRYRSAGSFQGITALHVQRRRLTLRGVPGAVTLLGAYGGRAADNTYAGSDLRRERRLYGRLRYQRPGLALELSNLHNRRSLGAQGGVVPSGASFETVYNPASSVRNAQARRRLIRNDLALSARMPLVPGLPAPLTAAVYWTAQTFRYHPGGGGAVGAETDRYGLRLEQDAARGVHRLRLRVGAYLDRTRQSTALPERIGARAATRTRLHAAVRDSLLFLGGEARLAAGLHTGSEQTYATASAAWARPLGEALRFTAGASLGGQPVSWVERYGFDALAVPVESVPSGRVVQGQIGLEARAGAFRAALSAFAHEISRPLDLFVATAGEGADTVAARVSAAPFRRAGLTGTVGWREGARRGLYAHAQATALRFLNASAAPENARVAQTLPDIFGRGRLGARFILFKDLDVDAYAEGRFWTTMKSRTLHPATGLLAVPEADARTFGPAGTVSLFAEAGLRTATLFFAYENALAGTELQPGVLIVPVYPLPEQRFRFGVYWPIFN